MEDVKSLTVTASPIRPRSPPSLVELDPRWDEGFHSNADVLRERDDQIVSIFVQNQSPGVDPLLTQCDVDRDVKDGGKGVAAEGPAAEDTSFSFYVAPKCAVTLEDEPAAAPPGEFLTPASILFDEPVRVVPAGPSSCKVVAAEEKEIPFSFNSLTADTTSVEEDMKVNDHRTNSLRINTARECPMVVDDPSLNCGKTEDERGLIDTAAPIESVKEAVSKFGGILDWKAHKVQAMERRKFVEDELEKALEEIPEYKKRSENSEQEKMQILKDLDSTKRLIEDLKLNVERAQKEEYQARQDSDLAKLRMEEIEQGIEDEASYATRAQLEVAKARYSAAVSELSIVKEELKALQEEFVSLVEDKVSAMEKAEEATAASREAERMVEELSIELIGAKEALESAQAAHLEAEEQRIGAAMTKEQECLKWEKELRQVEEELSELHEQIKPVKDLKSSLETASTLLGNLKAELANYMESAVNQEKEKGNELKGDPQALKGELETVKSNLEKSTAEVNRLKVAAASLESELQAERMAITAIKEREELALLAIESLKAELDRIKSEISLFQDREYENQEKMVAPPKQLMQGAREVDRTTSFAERARQELNLAKEEVEQAKEGATTMQSQLEAILKEIEAAKASEKLALEAIKALEDSESTEIASDGDMTQRIKLSLEEYYELSRKAREAEEQANMRVAEAVSQIDAAKESERECLEKLEQVNLEKAKRKEELRYAMEKAEKSQASKLEIEQELRKWKAEHEQKREGGSTHGAETSVGNAQSYEEMKEPSNFIRIPEHPTGYPTMPSSSETEAYSEGKHSKKKKKPFFPRILLFLARRKTHRHS
ncbi:hypothetical protein MLD38_022307 [Melastoma candidum]|uniref:Uncharacterized protein n=1 Tax=Melastoma candidum TaxID=119954 RepID=A0ACB9QJD3_9MYRT|nr:hypothetical protein MLD38_022307 [Melastoma candidum]